MTAALSREELDRLRDFVTRRLGLVVEDAKLDELARALHRRLAEIGCDRLAAYLPRLASPTAAREEARALARDLTVGETYFFRTPDHFRAFSELALPDRLRARAAERRLRLLSAGCASGEEAYTLAILARERVAIPAWDVRIDAIDVNPAIIARAREGRFTAWSLRETPPAERACHFREDGRDFVLDAAIRAMITFEERNLLEDDPAFWQPGAFDVIFCRNVIIYFSPTAIATVIARCARALAPGGYLFLGHAETLRGVSQEFHLRHAMDTFFYQKKDGASPAPTDVVPSGVGAHCSAPLPEDTMGSSSWVDTIKSSSERIAALSARTAERPVPPAPVTLGRALDLFREERFEDAVDLLRALPPEAAKSADAQLLEAASLLNRAALAEAEAAALRVLEQDELNVGAHYLRALCREHAGDLAAAREHDRTAVYLDATFSMPRLHLGLLAKRTGDRETARRELGLALELLAREDASRLLLFGGGFAREALVELCRAQLYACGGAP